MSTNIKFTEVFKNKDFFLLWLGKLCSQSADSLQQMAALALVTLIAPGSIIELVKLLVAINLPPLVLGPLAGIFIDRWHRKKIMVLANIFQGLLIMSILLLSHRLPHLLFFYVIMLLFYICTTFLQPTLTSSIASFVPRQQLLVANSLSIGTAMICLVIGGVLGNMLTSRIGISRGFYVAGVTYFFAAIILALISNVILKQDAASQKKPAGIKHIFTELLEGAKAILADKFVNYALTSLIILMSGAGIFYVIFVMFIKLNLVALGLIFASVGLGLVTGTLMIGLTGQNTPKEKIILQGIVSACIIILFFAALIPLRGHLPGGLFFAILIFISLCLGIAIGPVLVSINTFIHEQIPQQLLGRVFALQKTLGLLTFLMSMLIIGTITTATTANFAAILGSTAILIIVMIIRNYRVLIAKV